jgi:hypothetical protein
VSALESLLDVLCVEFGFCLPPSERALLLRAAPQGVRELAVRVWTAEMTSPPSPSDPVFSQLHDAIRDYPRLGTTRVLWPDGSCIASVEVEPDCQPRETSHVIGAFEKGPGFPRLEPFLEEFRRRYATGDMDSAFGASTRMDELGITAIDELGRAYRVFNINFDGLLFAVAPED